MNKKIVLGLVIAAVVAIGAVLLVKGRKAENLQTDAQPPSSAKSSPAPDQGAASSQSTAAGDNTAPTPTKTGELDSDNDGVPDVAEKTLGTDPNNPDTDGDGQGDLQDKDPALAENPIKNDAVQEGFKITEALVENNLDPVTKKAASDHLELSVKNTAGKDLTNFEIYYTITDSIANKKEGYYNKLSNFVIKSGETKAIHFDNLKGDGHFSENPNSIYRTNGNAKVFDIILSAPGYKLEEIKVNKDPGGDEKND